jgi:hypothetical protein
LRKRGKQRELPVRVISMRKLFVGMAAGLLLLCASGMALADAAGIAKGVAPSASAAAKGKTRTLVVGSDVFIGDLVQTGPQGDVQILFADSTALVVGPHSSLKIEDYLLRNNGDAGKFAVDMLSGVFRFATGDGPKNKYQIDTPNGMIGVRGTRFDVFVGKVVTRLMMYQGTTRACSRSGRCVNLSGVCRVGEFSNSGAQVLGDARTLDSERAALRSQFMYAVNPTPLLRAFRFGDAAQCLNRTPVNTVTPSIADPDIIFPRPPRRDGDGNSDGG